MVDALSNETVEKDMIETHGFKKPCWGQNPGNWEGNGARPLDDQELSHSAAGLGFPAFVFLVSLNGLNPEHHCLKCSYAWQRVMQGAMSKLRTRSTYHTHRVHVKKPNVFLYGLSYCLCLGEDGGNIFYLYCSSRDITIVALTCSTSS